MPSGDEPPPHHLLSTQRLAMLMAWMTELGKDRSEFRYRLNEVEENLQLGLENTDQASGSGKGGRQVEALRAALAAIWAA